MEPFHLQTNHDILQPARHSFLRQHFQRRPPSGCGYRNPTPVHTDTPLNTDFPEPTAAKFARRPGYKDSCFPRPVQIPLPEQADCTKNPDSKKSVAASLYNFLPAASGCRPGRADSPRHPGSCRQAGTVCCRCPWSERLVLSQRCPPRPHCYLLLQRRSPRPDPAPPSSYNPREFPPAQSDPLFFLSPSSRTRTDTVSVPIKGLPAMLQPPFLSIQSASCLSLLSDFSPACHTKYPICHKTDFCFSVA